jgi:hypothetical protein
VQLPVGSTGGRASTPVRDDGCSAERDGRPLLQGACSAERSAVGTPSGHALHFLQRIATLIDMANRTAVSEVRAWAKEQGFALADRGRLPAEVWTAWEGRAQSRALPRPRAEVAVAPAVPLEEFDAAQARIAQLEQQVGELTVRLDRLEARVDEPRRRFGRAR